jgi:small basic protein (TIGR04137 family)
MSIDRSLRLKTSLVRHRNVLSRAERIARILEGEPEEAPRPFNLPKIANRKAKAGKKAADEEKTGEAAAAAAPAEEAKAKAKPGA